MKTQEKNPSRLQFQERKRRQLHSRKWNGQRETVTVHLPGHQKSASRVKTLSIVSAITAKRWYSETRFSKKLVFPSREIFSMKSKGFSAWKAYEKETPLHWWFWKGNSALKTPTNKTAKPFQTSSSLAAICCRIYGPLSKQIQYCHSSGVWSVVKFNSTRCLLPLEDHSAWVQHKLPITNLQSS